MASLKFIASQARSIHQNKNLKIKVLNCCADIFFNRQYLTKKIVPNYAKIKSIIYYTNLIIHKETVSLKKNVYFIYTVLWFARLVTGISTRGTVLELGLVSLGLQT